jgi:hypothetical protein
MLQPCDRRSWLINAAWPQAALPQGLLLNAAWPLHAWREMKLRQGRSLALLWQHVSITAAVPLVLVSSRNIGFTRLQHSKEPSM